MKGAKKGPMGPYGNRIQGVTKGPNEPFPSIDNTEMLLFSVFLILNPFQLTKKENQNIEFKESWRDESLQTVCAFANTSGGKILIGIDDKGNIKELPDLKRLLEDIPNKIKNKVGVLAGVNTKRKNGKEYLEIDIQAFPSPASYKGKMYVRSGSTTRELNGVDLQQFLLKKSNISWESLPEENAALKSIDKEAIEEFKIRSKDRKPGASKETNLSQLLSKLHLVTKKSKLTRAAILLFGKYPQQHYADAIIKIGRFSKDESLLNSDVIEGNLFTIAEETIQVLKNKYLNSDVNFGELYRNENLEYPESALREAIINAIAHKDYSGDPVQIKVYSDQLIFWNPGLLPLDLTIEHLRKRHSSHARNKVIADVLFSAGLIEAYGSGTTKMINECKKVGLPEPFFEEYEGGIRVTFSKDIYTEDFLKKSGLNERQIQVVLHLKEFGSINNQTFQELTKTAKRTATRDLSELAERKIIEKTGITGKGTAYTLKGYHRNVRPEKTEITQSIPLDDLDNKLSILDKELEIFDPEEELKIQFDKKLFSEILENWLSDFASEVIPVIQKFNKYFVDPNHHITLPTPLGGISFVSEDINSIIVRLKEQREINWQHFHANPDSQFYIMTSYGSFRKTGLQTFGCNYSISIKFSKNWYELIMDTEVMLRNNAIQFKRQYHKPISRSESKSYAKQFGELIYNHIYQAIAEIKKRTPK